MKIVHIACVAPPQTGGVGRVAYQEVRGLEARYDRAVLLSPQSGTAEGWAYVERLPVYWSVGNAAAVRHNALVDMLRGADVVHLHYPFFGTASMVARLRRTGRIKRLVITLHMDAKAGGWKGLFFDLHRRFAQPRILSAADALLASSLDYAKHSSFASFASQIIELPFGVDETLFSPGPGDRAAYGIPNDAKVIVFVGGMDTAHAFKGVDHLLTAVSKLPENVWCFLVGDGDLRPGFEKLASDLGIAGRVRFRGCLADDVLPDVYRLGDVFAFPSTSGAEAFGLVALEAQACGIPVVASDLPGVRTVVEDKVTGLLTPPRDVDELVAHLRLILENPEMRETMGRAARARVLERFTWTRHMDDLIRVYTDVCASPS